jgi:cysteine desulfurase/selenocysteine lyase
MGFDTKAIDEKVTQLAARLGSELIALGLPVCGGLPGRHTGSIVAIGNVDSLSDATASSPEVISLHRHLIQNKVMVSVRRGMLRFSLHLYNTEEDVTRVVDYTQSWLKTPAARSWAKLHQ